MTQPSAVSKRQLVRFLTRNTINAGFIDKLKIGYRPYICPFEDLLALVNPGDRVFDIGCGSGQFALLVANFTRATKVSGIEISDKLIANANQLFSERKSDVEFQFSVFDGVEIPARIKDSDIIFLIDVLHHVPRDQQVSFLQRIYKEMAEGAKLVLKDINAASSFVFFNKVHDLVFAGEIGNELKLDDVSALVENIGFTIVRSDKKTEFVYPHYLLVLQKGSGF